ncbi:hypothetical protein [Chitinophaga pinensis]|uniref:Uncharacterized protein n=1 Tax=Chitinophaga pinensis TaxID=79329 RepID=A0A5C6LM24_9BACT|nr:hypothetical protein [Chitinophaga pinensis]TWV97399.1 hypothetical protein FEF09_22325 [Chitinophaga pinensis]
MLLLIAMQGCSHRYIVSGRLQKQLAHGNITRAQYDSSINTFYSTNRDNFTGNVKVKKQGSYVQARPGNTVFKPDYIALKFADSSLVYASYQFDTLSNEVLARAHGTHHRYTTSEGELILEYLLTRDFHVYNILRYARISDNGDTLTFYKTQTLQLRHPKYELENERVYIYDSTLTAIPIMPE